MEGKTVVLGVTGGIAAYKSVEITSRLVKRGASVHVIMTEAATKFVEPRHSEYPRHRFHAICLQTLMCGTFST